MLQDRLSTVEERLTLACQRAGRKRDEVLLLAVTKIFPAEVILEAYALGLRDFGENYVQEFEGKYPLVQHLTDARFHLIGHLQSNKTKKASELFCCIHTIDSPKIAARLNGEKEVFIEVKLSEEASKHGCAPADLPALIDAIAALPNLKLSGLMTMPPWDENPETARPYFIQLRKLAEQYKLPKLSMGMSNDLEVAIEEGSTIVRVGTALFGKRQKPQ
ncbi:YggS family pyridoxal phosphate-dependent enzyme [Bryobacter aggregatus]|uniref:YggS family pyridoxal phosphate-dependent enzyme n=1 Tax=Bryobacter aggregatus TaxID=360054 RepID=UPI0004E1BF73|nr:YggS family pyridoxal phosphate-dependent enzyme [Bryobacter aggregatus]